MCICLKEILIHHFVYLSTMWDFQEYLFLKTIPAPFQFVGKRILREMFEYKAALLFVVTSMK